MTREELLQRARRELWAGWALSAEEIGSQAAATLYGLGMLVAPGEAAELVRLRKRVAELEQQLKQAQAAGELIGAALVDEALGRLTVAAPLEDPHDSPLHHRYRLGRDLPPLGGVS